VQSGLSPFTRHLELLGFTNAYLSRFGVSPAPALHLLATTHLSELRLSRLALFTVTHLHKLSIASAIQPQFNPSILPAQDPFHDPLQYYYIVTFEGYSYSASRDLALRLALHTQIKSWVLVNTLRSPPMQRVKRRLCIIVLLAKDLLAQLEA
jgi:hypothetical protein